jgi:hypothetical protein
MNKTIKTIVIIGLIIFVGLYVSHFVLNAVRYGYTPHFNAYKAYLWIFKDSVIPDLDTNFCYSFIRKKDVYNNFHYKKNYNIVVWEFKDFSSLKLDSIRINEKTNLDNLHIKSGVTLNSGSDLEITIKYGSTFNNSLTVNLDKYSSVDRYIVSNSYKGFYGSINNITLSNEKNEHQALLDYTNGKTPTIFLIYTGHSSFFLIMINSTEAFDERILNILNLK